MADRGRFEEVIYEANNIDSPSDIRQRELKQVVVEQLQDQFMSLLDQIDQERFHVESTLMTKELWDILCADPEFNNEGK